MTEEKLWAVHAQGPDCLYPAKSIESAEKMAGEMNDLSKKARAQHGSDLPLAHAIVIPSPWSEVEHWKALAEQEESFCEEARQGWSACVKQLARAQALHKPAHDLSWAAQGDANVYSIIKGGNWLAQVRLNGELLVAEQEDWMRRFTAQQPAGQPDHVEQALNMAQEALAASPAQEVQAFKEDPRSAQELSLAGCNCIRFGEGNPHWPCRLHPRASALRAEQQGGLSRAARDVLAERRRQIEAEGMTTAGDDGYHAAELPRAAAAYILNGSNDEAPCIWPWAKAWWKPRDARSNYVRAGALILAEIERLDRAALSAQQSAQDVSVPKREALSNLARDGELIASGWNACLDEFHKLNPGAGRASGLLGWAVSRWEAEVSLRPLHNLHRRSLDDTWRQVIRRLGGNDHELCGPPHDALLNEGEA